MHSKRSKSTLRTNSSLLVRFFPLKMAASPVSQLSVATVQMNVAHVCLSSLSGLSPFMGDSDNETLSNVTSASWDFEDEAFDEISENAKDFITNLLKKDMR